MPTIEFVCVGQKEPLNFPEAPFAVRAENKARSHRGLFYAFYKTVEGCIYHLGNPYLKNDGEGGFFAHMLMGPGQFDGEVLSFHPRVITYVDFMLRTLLAASPEGRVFVSSDYQFGPPVKRFRKPRTLEEFWLLNNARELSINALYVLRYTEERWEDS